MEPIITIEKIDPRKAKEYLKYNNNRKLNINKVNLYASDIKNNNWGLSNDAITFLEDGTLNNGQHRLNAIIKADKEIESVVIRNFKNLVNMDIGLSRSPADNLKMNYGRDDIDNRMIAIVKLAYSVKYTSKPQLTIDDIYKIILKYEDELKFTRSLFKKNIRIWSSAPIQTTVFIAKCCKIPESYLERFVYVLYTGYSESSAESPIIALRNHLLNRGNVGGGAKIGNELVRRSMWTLSKYIDNSQTRMSRLPDNFIYEIPEMEK